MIGKALSCAGVFCLMSAACLAADPASGSDSHYDERMAKARDALYANHGNQLVSLVLGERLETQFGAGDDSTVWEAQGWVGGDLRKWWWKTEGDYGHGEGAFEEVELQSLYSRAVAPFWDVQMGVRLDVEPTPLRTYATLGVQGVAPYWFELDAALFLSDRGDLSARLEAEYELRLTQRLLLQPRVELNVALTQDTPRGVDNGLTDVEAGLRLRYEVRREFAPYLGAVWARDGGGLDEEATSGLRLVGGFRFWF